MDEEPLEQALRRALRPLDPGEAFAEQLVQRIAGAADRRSSRTARAPAVLRPSGLHTRRWLRLAFAACLLVAAGLGLWRAQLRPAPRAAPPVAAQAEQARMELLQALNIASASVNQVRATVLGIEGSPQAASPSTNPETTP